MILEHGMDPDGGASYRLSITGKEAASARLSDGDRRLLALAEAGTVSMKLAGLSIIASRIEEARERRELTG